MTEKHNHLYLGDSPETLEPNALCGHEGGGPPDPDRSLCPDCSRALDALLDEARTMDTTLYKDPSYDDN